MELAVDKEIAEAGQAAMDGESTHTQQSDDGLLQLFRFADPLDKLLMALGTCGALVAGTPLPLCAFLFGKVLDDAHSSIGYLDIQEKRMTETAVHAFIAGLIAAVAYFLQVACWMTVGERQAERMRYLYLKSLLRQDLSFYDQEVTAGDAMESIIVDAFHIKQATGEKIGNLLQIFGTLLSGYIIAFIEGWKLTFVASIAIPLIVISGFTMGSIVSKISKSVSAANSKASCIVEQVITAIRTVVPFGGERKALKTYNGALRDVAKAGLQEAIATGTGVGIMVFFTFGIYAITLWFGLHFIVNEGYTGGQVMTVLFSVIIGTGMVGQCIPSMNAISCGRTAACKMMRVIGRVPSVDVWDDSGRVLHGLRGEIELRKVSFAYPTRPDYRIFQDLSLRIPAGTTLALVGESGSGKSTIVSLIERFYDPLSGQVCVDGIDLRHLRLSWFRQQVALVAQEPVLLQGSIRDNIAYGKEGSAATDEEVLTAAKKAEAANFVARLPQGMETPVGQGGVQLSGGQKQRIAVARALLKNPRILLLDEATSALDAESENALHRALDTAMQQSIERTTVIVAHRLTTVKNADFIAVLQRGSVAEEGTYTELINKADGAFAQLVQLEERQREKEEHPKEGMGFASASDQWPRRSVARRSGSIGSISSLGSFHQESVEKDTLGSFYQESVDKGSFSEAGANSKASAVSASVSCTHALRLAVMNKPETPLVLLGSIAAACNGAIFPIVGLFITNIIQVFFMPRKDVITSGMVWIYFFIGLAFLSLVLTPVQVISFFVAGERLVYRIRSLTFDKILHQDIKWFDHTDNASGLISSRLQQDAALMRVVGGDGVSTIVQNLTTVGVGLFIAMSTCWQLALLFIALLPFYSLDACMQMKLGEAFDAKTKAIYEETGQIAYEALSNIRTVASFCAEKKILSLYRTKSHNCLKDGRRQALIAGIGFAITYVMMFGSLSLSFWAGGKLIFNRQVDFDGFVKTFLTVELSATAIALSLGAAPDFFHVKMAMASIFKLLDMGENDLATGMKLKQLRGEVKFEHVEFAYPARPDIHIISNLSFSLEAGKTIALVGHSGCGKSTVLALMQRFYDPDAGRILLDNVDIRQLQMKWLRRQFGLVGQEPFLFNDTIRANIEYGVEGKVADELLQRAAEVANADKFISAMPDGYDTIVGERGVQLSGGQKQRVAIARAMIRDPTILLLDEATSALDSESEVIVQEALERAAAGRSTMVVAHRLSTVRKADLIVVLHDGRVAEQGSHDELVAMKDGIYASFVKISSHSNNEHS
ncbi:hypothetical protein KP509_07G010800 [Ceratopteris richardii]|uniref:Uncharacterized protein n=3 Tax=Ceratopteris richardii TaxID=49495 RepID=A0A8T2U7F0_CERRI|nr:hypothetical protein KP509_07G010800 [Ceratopteris richardii]